MENFDQAIVFITRQGMVEGIGGVGGVLSLKELYFHEFRS